MDGQVSIRNDADWVAAGAALVEHLSALPDTEDRLRLLNQCCRDFGDQLYPGFLKLLCAIGHFGDDGARALVADTLGEAISTARLPVGRMAAWGGALPASDFHTPNNRTARSFGPVEYLCTWHMEGRGEAPLNEDSFADAARMLVTLLASGETASTAYADKLRQEVDDPVDGTYSRSTRQLLDVFATGLAGSQPPDALVADLLVRARSIRAAASRTRWQL